MGALGEALADEPKGPTGRQSTWPEIVAALPPDAVEDLLAAFADPTIEVTQIVKTVERLFPDVPRRSLSTWRTWARECRHG